MARPLNWEQMLNTLYLIAEGKTEAQAARRLGISPHAVNGRMRTIRQHLGAETTAHAVSLAISNGLMPLVYAEPSLTGDTNGRVE